MKMKTDVYILAAFALLMMAIFFASLQLEYLDAKLMPMLISAVGFVLAAIGVGREIWCKEVTRVIAETGQTQEQSKKLLRRYLYEGAWFVGFGVAIYFTGFLVAIPLFTISYLKVHGRKWLTSVTIGAVMTSLYPLFAYVFGVDLYPGLILELIG